MSSEPDRREPLPSLVELSSHVVRRLATRDGLAEWLEARRLSSGVAFEVVIAVMRNRIGEPSARI